MTLQYYFDKIAAAESAHELFSLIQDARTDGELPLAEVVRVQAAVNRRFSQLNAALAGPQKARW